MSNSHIIKFSAREQIFKVGDTAKCAYVIESGRVDLYPHTQSENKIATLQQGELLGEMGVISGVARSTSAFAQTDVELLVIDHEQITARLKNSDPIIRTIIEVLLKRIRGMMDVNGSIPTNAGGNIATSEGMRKIRLERELFKTLANDEIVNVYQPMVDFNTGEIAGFEALSRWQHPEKGMISPFEFISLAEESDFIVPMGLKIFDSACRQLAEFQKIRKKNASLLPPLFMSINVSSPQLTAKNFLTKIKSIVGKYGINPQHIKIEITESLVLDYNRVHAWIDECTNFGFKLSMDDFGTGHSSFEHLLELDFHTIKIDQTFVKSINNNPKSIIMLEAITNMAKRMNMSVVAEGIEDQQSAEKLKNIGIDYAQGYYFFKPMKPQAILKIL
ncbi:MAG: EAL domain-containing protein [Proteobacteria bacterium]|nr:EAL domain-containing protein [Pseudomonadota bacterium]